MLLTPEKVLHRRRNEIVVRTDPEKSKPLRVRFIECAVLSASGVARSDKIARSDKGDDFRDEVGV